ncbi:MAG: hypothetical protein WCR08_03410 [Gammaproteobacteria bacterium]
MKFYLKNMDFKEKNHFFKKIEKIAKIICKHGLHEFDYTILEEEFEKLSKELKNRLEQSKKTGVESTET